MDHSGGPRAAIAGQHDAAGSASSRVQIMAAVQALEGCAADLGWPEATALADGLVDALAHLLIDLSDGARQPTIQPRVVGAIGGPSRPVDHASCRAAAATLLRIAPLLAGPAWAVRAGSVAVDLAGLFEQLAERGRSGRSPQGYKSVVLRRLHAMSRRLQQLEGTR